MILWIKEKNIMKKKIISLLLASAIATTAIGLTACGDDGDGDNNALKSDKVSTAEQWVAAFDFSEVDNVTMFMDGWENRAETLWFDGDKFKLDDGKRLYIIQYKDDEPYNDVQATQYYYSYDQATDKWSVERDAIYDRDDVPSWFKYFNKMTEYYDEDTETYKGKVSDRYSEFTYSDKEYAYVAEYDEIDDITDIRITVKIKNGKVAEGTMTGTFEDEGGPITTKLTIKLYDFGKTKITLPDVE